MDVDVAARTISYALVGVAEKVSAFRAYDPSMPEREAMWRAVQEMVDRFVQVDVPRGTREGEVE
jgi:nitrogen-specific signal transduction histidine kinase